MHMFFLLALLQLSSELTLSIFDHVTLKIISLLLFTVPYELVIKKGKN